MLIDETFNLKAFNSFFLVNSLKWNKISRLPLDAAVQMLDGMSAANVERIELITSPPAKYDAEGTTGIIHIVMQENAGPIHRKFDSLFPTLFYSKKLNEQSTWQLSFII